jgi:hypothetical protein
VHLIDLSLSWSTTCLNRHPPSIPTFRALDTDPYPRHLKTDAKLRKVQEGAGSCSTAQEGQGQEKAGRDFENTLLYLNLSSAFPFL